MAARCIENWPNWLVNKFNKHPPDSGQLGDVKIKWEKYALSKQYGTVIRLYSAKKSRHIRQQGAVRIGPTD